MTLACFGMGLTFEEALAAATINGAYSLDRHQSRRQPRARQADGRRPRRGRRDRSDSRRHRRDFAASSSAGALCTGRVMKLIERSVADLLAAFRSSDPTPGGGSAAALAGRLGSSLLAMVAGLPKSRAATAEDAARLTAAGDRCAALAARTRDADRPRQRRLRPGHGRLQEAQGDRRGEGRPVRGHPGRDARGDRRAARP